MGWSPWNPYTTWRSSFDRVTFRPAGLIIVTVLTSGCCGRPQMKAELAKPAQRAKRSSTKPVQVLQAEQVHLKELRQTNKVRPWHSRPASAGKTTL